MSRSQSVIHSIFEPNQGGAGHSQGRSGGGNTDMKPAKFLSRPVKNPKTATGSQNSRKKRRDRWNAAHPIEP
jgi:hypothetical protein